MSRMNSKPLYDGDVTIYETQKKNLVGKYWNSSRKVFFINGMDNQPKDHRDSALKLSYLQLCQVIGIFNKSDGQGKDIGQCLRDKLQFSPEYRNKFKTTHLHKTPAAKEKILKQSLSFNKAALSLFEQLSKSNGETEIFAHSQGNLILSNVLFAINLLHGKNSLKRFKVHSFGSPAVNWPKGFTHLRRGYSNDLINLMAGVDWSFSISKVGRNHKASWYLSHNFMLYLEDDAAFTINHFSWGNANKISMDEEGLAKALVKMGTNIPRITKIFQRLDKHHNADADDVAFLYLKKIENLPSIKSAVKNNTYLNALLYKSLDEGWTTKAEYKAMARLKA